jgi:hypothetical protein
MDLDYLAMRISQILWNCELSCAVRSHIQLATTVPKPNLCDRDRYVVHFVFVIAWLGVSITMPRRAGQAHSHVVFLKSCTFYRVKPEIS